MLLSKIPIREEERLLLESLNYVYDHVHETKNMTDTEGAVYLFNNWNHENGKTKLTDSAVTVRAMRNIYKSRYQMLNGKKEIYTALLEREV